MKKHWKKIIAWFRNKLQKWQLRRLTPLCYTTLEDLPIHNWWKIQESGNLAFLFREEKRSNQAFKDSPSLKSIYDDIFDQYIRKVGWGKEQEEVFNKLAEIGYRSHLKYNGDTDQQTFINIAKTELAQLKEASGKQENNFYLNKARMEKLLGFAINPKLCSVMEYHSYIKMIEKDVKKNKHG